MKSKHEPEPLDHWLLTVQLHGVPSTISTKLHPSEWLAKYRRNGLYAQQLIFALPITQTQHLLLEKAGYSK